MEEMEYKCMLEPEEYRRIMEWMDCAYAPPGFLQINYLYDTEGYDLHRMDVTLRVRQAGGRLSVQCKFGAGQSGDIHVRTELEKKIDALPDKIHPGEWFDHEKVRDLPQARLLGCLITERRVYGVEPGVDVTLDRNHYLGHTDWELEIEFDGGSEDRARYWRGRLYPGSGPSVGKRARFMEAHRRIYG